MSHLLSAETSPCLSKIDPSSLTRKDAEATYSIMQRIEVFSMIACNLAGLVSFLRASPESYLDVEPLVLLMHHYAMRVGHFFPYLPQPSFPQRQTLTRHSSAACFGPDQNWSPNSPAETQVLPFAINNTVAFLQFSAWHEIIRSTYSPTSKGHLPFPSHPRSLLALESFDRLSRALEANIHHGFKAGSSTAMEVKQELEGTLAFWKAFFSLSAREEGSTEAEIIEFGTFLIVCEDEGMGNCEGADGRGVGTLICAKVSVHLQIELLAWIYKGGY